MQAVKAKRQDISHHPDPDLVALVLAGDGLAFAAIMTRYNQRLYRVARGVVRDEAEAEDVLQEAYVRAFAALPGFRGESALGDLAHPDRAERGAWADAAPPIH